MTLSSDQHFCITLTNTTIRKIVEPLDLYTSTPNIQYKVLAFENDRISNISEGVFLSSYAKEIEIFSLKGNQLKTLPARLFKDFEELLRLDLSNNHLSGLAFQHGEHFSFFKCNQVMHQS